MKSFGHCESAEQCYVRAFTISNSFTFSLLFCGELFKKKEERNKTDTPMTVATTSKQSSGLFWKSFTKGNVINGRYSTSPKMAAQ